MRIHTHTIYKHTHTHIYIYTHIHTYTHTYILYIHTHINIHIYTYIQHIYIYTHTHLFDISIVTKAHKGTIVINISQLYIKGSHRAALLCLSGQVSRPVAGKAKSTFGGRRRVESGPDIGVCSKATCWSRC